jgi:subtilisin family serine protease
VKLRTRIVRVFAAFLAVLVIAGFSTAQPASPVPAADVADGVRAALADGGEAPVIVRMREQADLDELGSLADSAVDTVLAGGDLTTGVRDLLGDVVGELPGGLLGRADVGTDEHTLDDEGPGGLVGEIARVARVATVVDGLQQVVAGGDTDELVDLAISAGEVRDVQEFWIFNGFAATVDDAALDVLAGHPDVASIVLDEVIELADASDPALLSPLGALGPLGQTTELAGMGLLAAEQPVNWGAARVRAPQAWDTYGVRGEGVVVGIMDSGVDGRHPALANSWRGATGDPKKSWFVATGERYPTPGDGRGHGTHIAGSILGSAGDQVIGVAPEAQWIAAKIFSDAGRTNASTIHRGFQWMLAPGGDPAAAPDIVNNSWGTSAANSTEFWRDIDAWIAAGIVPVFAVGNRGPRSSSLSSPASFPHVIAVGATDGNDRIVRFSSRGPITWNGRQYAKPNLVAPGYRIRSAWTTQRGGGYRLMSGTSMATPHVSGVAALVRSANPDASVAAIRRALEGSARPGAGHGALPDNTFGHGIVDAPEALKRAASR